MSVRTLWNYSKNFNLSNNDDNNNNIAGGGSNENV